MIAREKERVVCTDITINHKIISTNSTAVSSAQRWMFYLLSKVIPSYPVDKRYKVEYCGGKVVAKISTTKSISMEPNILEDIKLSCVGCKTEFVWTKGEQAFLQDLYEKGMLNGGVVPPKRCKKCRAERKAKKNQEREGY